MLFKILHGDASRISTDITPFHEGYCYVTHDGYMYVDMNVGTVDEPDNQRIKLNAGNAELLTDMTFDQIIEAAKANASAQDVVVLAEAQTYTDTAVQSAKDYAQDLVDAIPDPVQSDWSIHDETDPAYVKNRTHWSKISQAEILPECQLAVTTDGYFTIENKIEAVVGRTYIVNWNGASYTCVASLFNGMVGIGNGKQVGEADTGEPFLIGFYPISIALQAGFYAIIIPLDGSVTCTISIIEQIEEIHKIDNKYLSDEVLAKGDWNADEGEFGHILNRTHYTEEALEEIIPETTVTFGDATKPGRDTGTATGSAAQIYPSYDEMFAIEWNGVKYYSEVREYTKTDGSFGRGIGNTGMFGGGVYAEYPFLIGFLTEEEATTAGHTYFVWVNDGSTTATFSVGKVGEAVHRLDAKYLPENIATTEYVENKVTELTDFLVDIADDKTCDKTSAEINAAYTSGRVLKARYQNVIYHLIDFDNRTNEYLFTNIFNSNSNGYVIIGGKVFVNTTNEIPTIEYGLINEFFTPQSSTNLTTTKKNVIQAINEVNAKASVQSDWSVNDEADPAYIKNRPFYTTDPQEVELCNGTYDFAAQTEDGVTLYTTQIDVDDKYFTYEEGQTIKVVYDGVEHNCTTKFLSAMHVYYIGNGSIINSLGLSEENTGEKFFYPLGNAILFSSESDAQHTIVISVEDTIDVPIPHKYLGLNIWTSTGEGSVVANDSENVASGYGAFASGYATTASGSYSHAEGTETVASGDNSHAEGNSTEASNYNAHAEGSNTVASGHSAHAEGADTEAAGQGSHAEGQNTKTSAWNAHAEGQGTEAAGRSQHVFGEYNIVDKSTSGVSQRGKYIQIAGNGGSSNARSNAYTLDWSGNAWFKGNIKVGGTGQDDTNAKTLATQEYVQSFLPKSTTVTIPAANWTGNTNPWSQVVTVNGTTENSKLDLCPTAQQIVALQNAGVSLMLQNDSGVITAWAIGNKPTTDYTINVLLTEVSVI